MSRRAVFLDRDGVLIKDVGLLVDAEEIEVLAGAPEALSSLAQAGYALVVVTNQTVVARGLATEAELMRLHDAMRLRLREQGGTRASGQDSEQQVLADLAPPVPAPVRMVGDQIYLGVRTLSTFGLRPWSVTA